MALTLLGHAAARRPKVHALAAFFCFQAARLPARVDADGELLLIADQDRSAWDQELLRRGLTHLDHAASGDALSEYHVQAEIAACHSLAPAYAATDWARIVTCYAALLRLDPSPVAFLLRRSRAETQLSRSMSAPRPRSFSSMR